ncbi:MAG: delta-60 repeat domain-containing protein [Bacteroidetes bacterium]|nr:delta-60 repeat domain-containing protein [Bacteroidota bacterium]
MLIQAVKFQIFRRRTASIVLLFSAYMLNTASAQSANPDMAATNNAVYATLVDGNFTYIGGAFSTVGRLSGNGVKMTTTSSSIDKLYPKVNSSIYTCISDGAGGWYIGGTFTMVGTTGRNRLAHINSDGTLDASWNPDVNDVVYSLLLNGNDLFIGGNFTTIGGQARSRIAKIDVTTGLPDASWNPGADLTVKAIALGGSSLFIGGDFATVGGLSRSYIAKLSTTGTGAVDASWNPGSSNPVVALAVSGTDLFAGGYFTTIGGVARNRIAKLSISGTGTVDASWNPNANSYVFSLLISGDNIFVGGSFTTMQGVARNWIAKLSISGTGILDPDWNPNMNAAVNSLATDGTSIFAAGNFTTVSGGAVECYGIAKLNATGAGTPETGWNPHLSGSGLSVAVSGTDIYVGGNFNLVNVVRRYYLARINNTTGEVDADWNPNPGGAVYALAVSATDVYAGGIFVTAGSLIRNRIARFSKTGSGTVDPLWDPNIGNGAVNALAINGTDIYAGGSFTTVNGSVSRNRLAKFTLESSAAVDDLWNPSINSTVNALVINASTIYVGGSFTSVNITGVPRSNLASFPLSGYGTVDSWNPSIGGVVYALTIDGSSIYVGGSFNTVNFPTVTRNRLARFPLSGTATVDTWNPNIGATVYTLAVSGSDIYVGGTFTTVNGSTTRNYLARISSSSGLADSWNPNPGNSVRNISVSGNDVYVGGQFASIGGNLQPYLALFTDRTLPVELVSFSASVTKGVVNLKWHTATEVDNYGFEVQRTTAGSDDWKNIGFIQGHHTTNSPKYYSFTDQPSTEDAYKYKYRLKQLDNSGSHEFSNIIEVSLGTPANFLLEQNYPNPFNPATVIRYQLPVAGMVSIDLYNTAGEKVASLLNKAEDAGVHSLSFDAVKYGLSSGIYIYRMTVVPASGEVFSSVRKLSLIK